MGKMLILILIMVFKLLIIIN